MRRSLLGRCGGATLDAILYASLRRADCCLPSPPPDGDTGAYLTAKHPRFHLHFTPTSSSWLNLIERWFGKLTDKAIRRGVFHSVPELITTIETYLTVNDENPEPFIWTATAEQILTKVQRGRIALQQNTTQN